MALAKKHTGIFAAAAGALLGAVAVFTPVQASAEDVTNTSNTTSYSGWTDELRQLDIADRAATEYARDNIGVGILVHVGQDIPNDHFASADLFGQKMVEIFAQRFGVEAQYFLSPNDAAATGITYHIDTFIHGADNGTAVKNVKEALAAMPEVVEYLRIAKRDQLAQLEPATLDLDN